MNFQLNIYGSPWHTNASLDAIEFAEQLMLSGHKINRCFFFLEAVYAGLATQSPSSDEFDLLKRWRQLANKDVPLFICVAAAANRGVLNAEEAKRYEKAIVTIADFFELVGLGQWASGFNDADRLVNFK